MASWIQRVYEDAAAGRLGSPQNRAARRLVEAVHVAVVLVRETVRDRLHVRAAMLAYWSAVAIVPILLLGFALTGPLGLTASTVDAVKRVLYDSILASSVEEVGAAVDSFLDTARLSTMGVLGVGSIMLIGSQLFFNVELAYNDIFRTRVRRSWFLRFTLFYAGITLGPLLLAAGMVASTRFVHGAVPFMSTLLPLFLTTVLLVGAIRLLPGTQVRWRAALAGGLTSAVLFEGMKLAFGLYTEILGTRDKMAIIYGSLSLLPVFLLWLYVLWIVVLFGVELAWVVQNHQALLEAQRRAAVDRHAARRHPDALFGLGLLTQVAAAFLEGREGPSAEDLAATTGADPRHVFAALEVLEDGGFIVEGGEGRYLPARPPEQVSAAEVVRAWRERAAPDASGPASVAIRRVADALDVMLDTDLARLAGARRAGLLPHR